MLSSNADTQRISPENPWTRELLRIGCCSASPPEACIDRSSSPSANTEPVQEAEAALVMGIDLGTAGARAVIASGGGDIVATARADLECAADAMSGEQGVRHEQCPEAWWDAVRRAIRRALRLAGPAAIHGHLRAVCVDATSGTVLGVDGEGNAVTPALMYNDARAVEEAGQLDTLARDSDNAAPRINASFAAAKMLWVQRHLPEAFAATRFFAHQADFITGRLIGAVGATDYSNALKSGFDLTTGSWATWLDEHPQLRCRLPRVVAPGERLGGIAEAVAGQLGLPVGLSVIAGVTDGAAAFLASGARRVGEDNTTLGTTLVFKRVADHHIQDPTGLLYCHKLPGGSWLPGAASNVGGDWIRKEFANADLGHLDDAASELLPVPYVAYPLQARGERFPFRSTAASAFCEPPATEPATRYAACLQGTAFVERLGYEILDRATGSLPSARRAVYATGGGSQSDVWTQLRADVSGRTYHRPDCHESAFGSAILAAAAVVHGNLREASRAMVRIARTFHPDPARHQAFGHLYEQFVILLKQRGFLTGSHP